MRLRHLGLLVSLSFLLAACSFPFEDLIRAIGRVPTPTPRVGTTWYVSTDGNDGNDCRNEATACRTIQSAVDRAAPGDRILVASGRYSASDQNAAARNAILVISKVIIIEPLHPEPGRGRPELFGEDSYPGIRVEEGGDLQINGFTIMRSGGGADARGAIPRGVGVIVFGQLKMRESSILDNQYAGVYNTGTANLVNVVIGRNGNTVDGWGGIVNTGSLLLSGSELFSNYGTGLRNTGLADIHNTTIRNSAYRSDPFEAPLLGAAIQNYRDGAMAISSSTISHNGALTGSGIDIPAIENSARLSISNSTISTNSGPGIYNNSLLDLSFVTVANNGSYGIYSTHSPTITDPHRGTRWTPGLTIENSLIVNNGNLDCFILAGLTANFQGTNISDGSCQSDSSSGFVRPPGGYFFIAPLADNGGFTQTHALLPGSNAIDGAQGECSSTDQRGMPRPAGSRCDVGAFEAQAEDLAVATALPIVIAEQTATPSPTLPAVPTFIPTETPTPGLPLIVFTQNANCRKGPSTLFRVVTAFEQGKQVQALGRNAENTWLLVAIPTGGECWVSVSLIEPLDLSFLPLLPTPIPPPQQPSQFGLGGSQCSPNGYTVILQWQDVNGETGYHLYRDGTLLATLAANATSYKDTPPFGGPYTYALEAFSAAGSSPLVQFQAPECKF